MVKSEKFEHLHYVLYILSIDLISLERHETLAIYDLS